MMYFNKEDFDLCMEFLADKPETVETQQKLYEFMQKERHIMPALNRITVKNMAIYSKVYATKMTPKAANWCSTMSDGSQVVWNRKYQEFYIISEVGMRCCSYLNCSDLFVDMSYIDAWLLENWSNWRFQETQKQLVTIIKGKFSQHYINFWK